MNILPLSLVLLSVWRRSRVFIAVGLALVVLVAVAALVFAPDDSVSVNASTLVSKPIETVTATPAEAPGIAQTVAAAAVAQQTAAAQALIPTPTPTLVPQPTPTLPPAVPTYTPLPPTATPDAVPTFDPYTAFVPTHIKIPAIGVDTDVESVGQTKTGAMDVPKNVWNVGWYNLGIHPGEQGSAVMAGHLDSVSGKAVFWLLNDLKPGDKIYLTDFLKMQVVFEVTDKQIYGLTQFPVSHVFDFTGPPMLNLITCNGVFDRSSQLYNNRLVVYSKFIGPA